DKIVGTRSFICTTRPFRGGPPLALPDGLRTSASPEPSELSLIVDFRPGRGEKASPPWTGFQRPIWPHSLWLSYFELKQGSSATVRAPPATEVSKSCVSVDSCRKIPSQEGRAQRRGGFFVDRVHPETLGFCPPRRGICSSQPSRRTQPYEGSRPRLVFGAQKLGLYIFLSNI